ncbi:MAG: glycosyltransferase family 4 protein [Bacteroidota bacterium]|nr:glycosyltransferase family 4 protein [Bacteroidota bacterium]
MKNGTAEKPRLLVVSHVRPFPGDAGQQKRVANMLKALRGHFTVDFLTFARDRDRPLVTERLSQWVDRPVVMSSRTMRNPFARVFYGVLSRLSMLACGVKYSNHLIGSVELNEKRIGEHVRPEDYSLVLYEYIHAWRSAKLFRRRGIPCILDMHDVLVRTYERYLQSLRFAPRFWKRYALRRYGEEERRAWRSFDGIVAINKAEYDELRTTFGDDMALFYAPMGIDMEEWQYGHGPAAPPRVAYYGGLGNPNNSRDAMACYEKVMPEVWKENPGVELWILGSNPPAALKALEEKDPRVKVPGFVEEIKPILGSSSVMLCPFTGRFGFRSRIVEAMALGVPVIAARDAVYGMEFENGNGIFIVDTVERMPGIINELLRDATALNALRTSARTEAERLYGFESSYGKAAREIALFAELFPRGWQNPYGKGDDTVVPDLERRNM